MSKYDFDQYGEGEFDDKEDLAWSEYDGLMYLRQAKKEVHHYFKFFQELDARENPVEAILKLIGWNKDAFFITEEDFDESLPFEKGEAEDFECDLAPYTVHRHPLYMVTTALYQLIRYYWEKLMMELPAGTLSSAVTWQFAEALREGETSAILAVNTLDIGDYTLTVCQLKHGLNALNESLNVVRQLSSIRSTRLKHINNALFILREIWLCVMQDCRGDQENDFD